MGCHPDSGFALAGARDRLAVRRSLPSRLSCLLLGATLLLAAGQRLDAAEADWRLVGLSGTAVRIIAIDPQTPNTLYAGVVGTVLRSMDAGRTWDSTGYGGDARLLLIDPANPSTLYALDSAGSVARSLDGAARWSDAGAGLDGPVIGLGLDAVEPSTLWAADYSLVWRSTDGAATWKESYPPRQGITAFAVSPTESGVWVGLYRDGIGFVGAPSPGADLLLVEPGGTTEHLGAAVVDDSCPITVAQSPIYSVTADPERANIVYAGYGTRICKTDDGGAHWRYLPDSIGTRIDFIDPFHPDTLYVFSGGLLRSTDGGETWNRFEEGFAPGVSVGALAADRDGRLYAATSDGLYLLGASEPASTPSPTAMPSACAGDCDEDGVVSISELVTLVDMALRDATVDDCRSADRDGNGSVHIEEILAAVDNSVNGCTREVPTPTPDPLESEMGICYESSDCFPCNVYPCQPFTARRAFCCHLALTSEATFSWCAADAFDASSGSCAQCAFPCPRG